MKRGMPMKTGLLNKRIEILGKQAVTDEYGFDTQADVVVYRCWASIEPARGKVFYEMEARRTRSTARSPFAGVRVSPTI